MKNFDVKVKKVILKQRISEYFDMEDTQLINELEKEFAGCKVSGKREEYLKQLILNQIENTFYVSI